MVVFLLFMTITKGTERVNSNKLTQRLTCFSYNQVQVDKNCNATVTQQNQMNVTPPLAAQTNQNQSQSQKINAQLTKPAPDSAPIKGVTTTTPVGKVSCNNKLFYFIYCYPTQYSQQRRSRYRVILNKIQPTINLLIYNYYYCS